VILVLGVRVPLDRTKAPVTVKVVQVIVPVLVYVPEVNAIAPEQTKLFVAKLTSPDVCVYVKQVNALARVVVPV